MQTPVHMLGKTMSTGLRILVNACIECPPSQSWSVKHHSTKTANCKLGCKVGAYQSLQSIFQILWYPASCEYVDSHVHFCIHLVHVLATSAPTPSKCDDHVPCTRIDVSFSLLECAMIRCCYQDMLPICKRTEIDLSSIF